MKPYQKYTYNRAKAFKLATKQTSFSPNSNDKTTSVAKDNPSKMTSFHQ